MKLKLFGTDGVRGVANIDLTPELVVKIGRASGYILGKDSPHKNIIVGKDTRISGDMLESALISGLCSVGRDVLKAGILPTPTIAYMSKKLNTSGVMISASHNPVEDNGIKFFTPEGFKITEKKEREIEKYLFSKYHQLPTPFGNEIGKSYPYPEAKEIYLKYLKSIAKNYSKLKIVIDCANGAVSEIAPGFFSELGAKVIALNCNTDGYKINLQCGSLYPEVVQKKVIESKADIGISFDGDADRIVLVDEKGNIITGDHILAILALEFKKLKKLNNNLIVATVMSNLGLDLALERFGIKLIRTPVGDRNVVWELIKRKGILGGEQAGHIIFLRHNPCSDGMVTVLHILNIMQNQGKSLSSLASILEIFPQVLYDVKVQHKEKLDEKEAIKKAVSSIKKKLGKRGRIVVRASGTEPKIRIMVEGEDKKEIETYAQEIKGLVEKELN